MKTENKKFLLTTEDGKDIYEGDEYYHLVIDVCLLEEMDELWKFHKAVAGNPKQYDLPEYKKYAKTFSTRESAAEYVRLNKRVFSVDDIKNLLESGGDLLENANYLAKTRI